MTDTTAFPFCFLQAVYALSRSTASNKLLKLNLRGKGVLSFKNFWDAEPLAYVSSWELAEEWVAKRIAQEKKSRSGQTCSAAQSQS
jgi:hypothetical protein